MFRKLFLVAGLAMLVTVATAGCGGGSPKRDLAVGDCVWLEMSADGKLLDAPEVPCGDARAQYKITLMSKLPDATPCPALTATSVALRDGADFLTLLCLAKAY